MGMVPNLSTGVWVGGEDRAIHFETIGYGQGATMALPIWGNYMRTLYENPEFGISKEDFIAPENLSISVDCEELVGLESKEKPKLKTDLEALGF